MDFLNKGVAQLADLLRSMTPAARITASLLLLVVIISLGYLFNHQMSGADELLFNGDSISSDQLPAMEGAFAKANLSGYQIDGGRIRVPRGQRVAFMAALVDGNALPKVIGGPIKDAVTSGGIFGTTKAKQEELHRNALQEELILVIRNMRGIEKASVLIDSQADGGLRNKKTMTASVSVKPTGNLPLEEERVPNLRNFVAAAVAGLSPDSVAVTDLNTGRTFAGNASSGNGTGMGNSYAEVKRNYERNWEDKIRGALTYIPGVVVTTNVELDTDVNHVEKTVKYDPKIAQTDVIESSTTTSQQSGGGGNGGRPGPASNGANAPGAVSSSSGNANHSQNETTKNESHGLAAGTTTEIVKASLTPTFVSATVGIPSSYIEKLWQEANPSAPGKEARKPEAKDIADLTTILTGKIQKHVGGLFNTSKGKVDTRGFVEVETFQQLTSDPIPTPGLADHAMTWLGQSWTTLGMGFLGFFSLIVLRSMVRAPAGSSAAVASPITAASAAQAASLAKEEAEAVEEAANDAEGDGTNTTAATRRKRRLNAGPTLKDDLVEIVREDPDAAANILRSWIGSGV